MVVLSFSYLKARCFFYGCNYSAIFLDYYHRFRVYISQQRCADT